MVEHMLPRSAKMSRLVVVLLASSGLAIIYALKVNMSMVLMAMVNRNPPRQGEGMMNQSIQVANFWDEHLFRFFQQCPAEFTEKEQRGPGGEFNWSAEVQGYVLGAYFWGYMLSQVPGGRLAECYGAKWVIFTAVTVNIVGTLLTPIVAAWAVEFLIALRVIEGIAGGVSFPATHVLLAKWAPVSERSVMSSMVYTGTCLGTVVSLLTSGIIADYFGWAAVFYFMGATSLPWLALWVIFVQNTPYDDDQAVIITKPQNAIPWRSIITCRPYLAIVIAHCFSSWGWHFYLTQTPHYFSGVLQYSLTASAVLSSLPFLLMLLFSLCLGSFVDRRRASNRFTTTNARIFSTLISCICPAFCLSLLVVTGCDRFWSVILWTAAIATSGGMFSGFLANHIDLADNYAGTLMALSNTFASISGFAVTYHAAAMTTEALNLSRWKMIFIETICAYIIEGTVYYLWASGAEQPWNKDNEELKLQDDRTELYH